MLAVAMRARDARTPVAVIALTALVSVVAVTGNGSLGSAPDEPYVPSRSELEAIGVITSDYPVPGQLPPEVFPAEAWGFSPPGAPDRLLWVLGALAVAVTAAAGLRLARELATWRLGWPWSRPRRRRLPKVAASSETTAIEPAPAEHEDDADAARQAVEAALAPLSEAADSRSAVIEAYARLEQVLAGQELGRRTPEAPREYLGRILRRQGMPEQPLTTLTALFEEARFSRHPVHESDLRRAASELRTVRRALDESTAHTMSG